MYVRYFDVKRGWTAIMNSKEDHYPCRGTTGCSSIGSMKALYSYSGQEQAVAENEQGWVQVDDLCQSEGDLYSTHADHLAVKASSLSEMFSLVELVEIGSISREEAIMCIDADCIRTIVEDIVNSHQGYDEISPPQKLLLWSDQVSSLKVFTGGMTPKEVWIGKVMGVRGLGLVRCEELLKIEPLKSIIPMGWMWDEEIAVPLQRRLLCLLQEQWESLFYALQGMPATLSLMPTSNSSTCSYLTDGIQDIQIEALFRAMRACEQQGIDCIVDILVTHPASAEQYADGIHFIEQVAEQTLGHSHRSIKYRVGALVPWNIRSSVAGELARCTNLLVVEWEERNVTSPVDAMSMEIFHHIRQVHPRIHIRAVGHLTSADLSVIYTLGIDEISCEPQEAPIIRIVAAQLELMEKVIGLHL